MTRDDPAMEIQTTADIKMLSCIRTSQSFKDKIQIAPSSNRSASGNILPSIVKIRRDFDDLVRYHLHANKASIEIQEFHSMIIVQQCAFENACRLLLSKITKSRLDVDNIVGNSDHAVWADKWAYKKLKQTMMSLYDLCLRCLDQVQIILRDLMTGFGPRTRQLSGQSTGRHDMCPHRRNSPRFDTMDDFHKPLESLRSYIDLFCTLIRQAASGTSARAVESQLATAGQYLATDAYIQRSVEDFAFVQQASQAVYEALSKSCSCRSKEAHKVNILLGSRSPPNCSEISFCGTWFNLVVAGSPRFRPCHMFVNTSSRRKDIRLKNGDADGNTSDELDANGSTLSSGPPVMAELACPTGCQTSSQNTLRNVGLENDLCLELQKKCAPQHQSTNAQRSCLGYLESRDGLDISVLHVLRGTPQKQRVYTLDDVLVHAKNECQPIPVADRLRTAASLATGFLRLRTSAWLPPVWSSQDIYFFETDQTNVRDALAEPYLQIRLSRVQNHYSISRSKDPVSVRSCLLSLGIVLIEIAFSAPWRELQTGEEVTKGLSHRSRRFLNLMRLSETVSRQLGSRYAKVVQACLDECWGPQGLEERPKERLDKSIFEKIVKELDECLSAVLDRPPAYSEKPLHLE